MDDKKENQNSNSAITVKSSNNIDEKDTNNGEGSGNTTSTQGQDYLTMQTLEVQFAILKMAAFDLGAAKRGLSNLALVCRHWNYNIVNNETQNIKYSIRQSWIYGRCGRNDIKDATEQEIFDRFYKGVLIYSPNPKSDEGRIIFPIANLPNPLEGTFDLSQCGNAGQYLYITTGYRKVQTPANAKKLEIWLTPWFLVDKEMEQLAKNHHINEIIKIKNWDTKSVLVGLFWTLGQWNATDHLNCCDYLTTESMDMLGSENLLTKWRRSKRMLDQHDPVSIWAFDELRSHMTWSGTSVPKFHISFGQQK